MGFAEYGVRNSEMSVTSGPCSDSESREALRNAFAQPPQCIDSHLPTGIPLEREIRNACRSFGSHGLNRCTVSGQWNTICVGLRNGCPGTVSLSDHNTTWDSRGSVWRGGTDLDQNSTLAVFRWITTTSLADGPSNVGFLSFFHDCKSTPRNESYSFGEFQIWNC